MTSTTHRGDVFMEERLRRGLSRPRVQWRPNLGQVLVALASVGVLVLLLAGHGVSWLGGLLAGASAACAIRSTRAPAAAIAAAAAPAEDDATGQTLAQLEIAQASGWRAVHDLEGRFGRYEHVAVGPGGVLLLQSRRLDHQPAAGTPADPAAGRELTLVRRQALADAANLRDELEVASGQPRWVQPVVVVWSEFAPGCVQDGRCVFVSGARLTDWLRRRPSQLSGDRVDELLGTLTSVATPVAA